VRCLSAVLEHGDLGVAIGFDGLGVVWAWQFGCGGLHVVLKVRWYGRYSLSLVFQEESLVRQVVS
jgi:hypothetical protein